ncbi:hypothetical protein ACIHAR_29415 [Streptomyces sp. NPDC052016]|uniref:hypothetical protein n=1 Tax=Streptomyces sp. NPDC052016 TaxID=3365680 RepID=UPI0037D8DA39
MEADDYGCSHAAKRSGSHDGAQGENKAQRLKALARAGTRIGATLDVLDTARGLAEGSVPGLADCMAVEVLGPVLAGEGTSNPVPYTATPCSVGQLPRSRDDEAPGTAADDQDGALPLVTAAEALAALQPRIVDPLSPGGQRTLRSLRARREEVHSLMLVPLVTQHRAIGLATFSRWGSAGRSNVTI